MIHQERQKLCNLKKRPTIKKKKTGDPEESDSRSRTRQLPLNAYGPDLLHLRASGGVVGNQQASQQARTVSLDPDGALPTRLHVHLRHAVKMHLDVPRANPEPQWLSTGGARLQHLKELRGEVVPVAAVTLPLPAPRPAAGGMAHGHGHWRGDWRGNWRRHGHQRRGATCVFALVEDRVLGVNGRLVEEDELAIRPHGLLAVPDHNVVVARNEALRVVARLLHHECPAQDGPTHQDRTELLVVASRVVARILVRLAGGLRQVIIIIFDVVGLLGIHRPHSTFMPWYRKVRAEGPLDQWRRLLGRPAPPVSARA